MNKQKIDDYLEESLKPWEPNRIVTDNRNDAMTPSEFHILIITNNAIIKSMLRSKR